MKAFTIALMTAGALALAACGDKGGSSSAGAEHPVCKDVASASDYVQKISAEIAQAAAAGKITPEQAQKATEKMQAEMQAGIGEKAAERPVGYMCTVMDNLKKELGL
ncbi:MAG: hypothetical protein U1F24_09910 [Alphaproteobacteria bacterium]|jgi:ABC-type oligopeptide transport system substrate-binding subunit